MAATAQSVAQSIIYPSKWVKLSKYCELTGDTEDAVTQRRKRGEWLDGKHTKVKGRRVWVNLVEADRWVESA